MINEGKRILLVMLFAVISFSFYRQEVHAANNSGELTVTFIDVGQGDCILLQSEGQTMLIDAGKSEYGTTVVKYLKEIGINNLTYAVITHDHADHLGGFNSVLQSINVGRLYRTNARYNDETICQTVNKLIDSLNIPISVPVAGSTMKLGSATIEFLAPNGSVYTSYNDNSIVMRVVNGKNSFLLTGDAETVSEKEMLARGYTLESDVLKVCHHSALTSSTQEFIDAVNPSISVITCDAAGASGFPRLATIEKLTESDIYRTDISGNITFVSDGTSITTEEEPYFYANSEFNKANGTITRTLEEESCVLKDVSVSSEYEGITLLRVSDDEDYDLTITKPLTLNFKADCGVSKIDSIDYALVESSEEPDIDNMEWMDTDNGKVTLTDDFEGTVYVKFENGLGNIIIRKTTGFLLDCTAPTNCRVQSNFSSLSLLDIKATNSYNRYTEDDTYPTLKFSCDYGVSGEGTIEYMLVNRGDGFWASDEWTIGDTVVITDDFIGRVYVRFTDAAGNKVIWKTQGFKWIKGKPTNLKITSNVSGVNLLGITMNGAKACRVTKPVKITCSADFGHGGKKAIRYQIVKKGSTYKAKGPWVTKSSLTLTKGFGGTVYVKFVDKSGKYVVKKTNFIRIS